MIDDDIIRGAIAGAITSAVNIGCSVGMSSASQEPVITDTIVTILESRLNGSNFDGYRTQIVSIVVPDRGASSLESQIGADVLFVFSVHSGIYSKSKGILVQSKKLKASGGIDYRDLGRQSDLMVSRSDASYVFAYADDGVTYLPAQNFQSGGDRRRFSGRPVFGLFSDILKCTSGDVALGFEQNEMDYLFSEASLYGDAQFRAAKDVLRKRTENIAVRRAVSIGLSAAR